MFNGLIRLPALSPFACNAHILDNVIAYDKGRTNANGRTPGRVQYMLKSPIR